MDARLQIKIVVPTTGDLPLALQNAIKWLAAHDWYLVETHPVARGELTECVFVQSLSQLAADYRFAQLTEGR